MDIQSITSFEATPLAMMRGHGQPDQYDQMKAMSEQFESDHLAGELDACARVIDYWGGAGSFAAMPEPLRDYCRSVAGTNAHDWRAGWAVDAGKADYAHPDGTRRTSGSGHDHHDGRLSWVLAGCAAECGGRGCEPLPDQQPS